MSEVHAEVAEKKTLGFWIYLMTDIILFASLFATFAVLRNATAGGPTANELFDLPFVLAETMILLTSSFTVGIGVLFAGKGQLKAALFCLVLTFGLGAVFLGMELTEFAHFVGEDAAWSRSAFLSAFFTLVGTHGLHITAGLIWMAVMIFRLWRFKGRAIDVERLNLLGLFWHFLDVIWIFIFTFVYLMGTI